MSRRSVRIKRNTSPKKRLRGARRSNGVMGLYPSLRGFELFWIPMLLTALLLLFVIFCVTLAVQYGFYLSKLPLPPGKIALAAAAAVLLLIADIAALIFCRSCPFCGCRLDYGSFIFPGRHFGRCQVCRKRLWGRYKGRKIRS